jgi:hypothetical protein
LSYFGRALEHVRKGDGTPVSRADLEVDATLTDLLRRERPDDAILSEERGGTPAAGGRRWIIDPIDGTEPFLARERWWGTQRLARVSIVNSPWTSCGASVPRSTRSAGSVGRLSSSPTTTCTAHSPGVPTCSRRRRHQRAEQLRREHTAWRGVRAADGTLVAGEPNDLHRQIDKHVTKRESAWKR